MTCPCNDAFFLSVPTERTCDLTPDFFARFYLRTRTVLGPPPFGESRYVPRTSADVAGATSAAGVAPSDVEASREGRAQRRGPVEASTPRQVGFGASPKATRSSANESQEVKT